MHRSQATAQVGHPLAEAALPARTNRAPPLGWVLAEVVAGTPGNFGTLGTPVPGKIRSGGTPVRGAR